jgi:uncharacterized protein
MKCPACSSDLSTVMAGEIELDVCEKGCGGIWFDRGELDKFDEKSEFSTHRILELAKQKENVRIDHNKQKKCPKCENETLARQFFDIENEVEIDLCWECGGIWLDPGEINSIRAQYETYEERSQAVNSYAIDRLKEAHAAMEANTRKKLADLERRYKWNPLARGLGLIQTLFGVERATDKVLQEQIFKADFDKLRDPEE